MDNYRSEWVLAQLKRRITTAICREMESTEYHYANPAETLNGVLRTIAEIEADSVLGTPEVVAQEVDKLLAQDLPGGDADCEACKIEFTEVK